MRCSLMHVRYSIVDAAWDTGMYYHTQKSTTKQYKLSEMPISIPVFMYHATFLVGKGHWPAIIYHSYKLRNVQQGTSMCGLGTSDGACLACRLSERLSISTRRLRWWCIAVSQWGWWVYVVVLHTSTRRLRWWCIAASQWGWWVYVVAR